MRGGSVAEWLARARLRRRRAWVQITVATLSGNSLRQTVHTRRVSVHQAAKLVAALLRVVGVTAGLAESNGRLPPGLSPPIPVGVVLVCALHSGTLLTACGVQLASVRNIVVHQQDQTTETLGCLHTHVPLSPSSELGTGRGVVMPCGWEGNRRSGVALAMRHRLQWFIRLRAHGPRKGDEHPAYTPHRVQHTLSFV